MFDENHHCCNRSAKKKPKKQCKRQTTNRQNIQQPISFSEKSAVCLRAYTTVYRLRSRENRREVKVHLPDGDPLSWKAFPKIGSVGGPANVRNAAMNLSLLRAARAISETATNIRINVPTAMFHGGLGVNRFSVIILFYDNVIVVVVRCTIKYIVRARRSAKPIYSQYRSNFPRELARARGEICGDGRRGGMRTRAWPVEYNIVAVICFQVR